jgi:hypothetical protein
LENCQYDLQTYIKIFKSNDPVTNDNWDHMLRFSFEVSKSLVNLHNRGIYLDGKLNPRTIWVQHIGQGRPALKIVLPGRDNAFNTCTDYNISWNQKMSKQNKDLFSLTLLLFFIQTCGCHFQGSRKVSSDNVFTNRTAFCCELQNLQYCSAELQRSCEYRFWKNSLAGHLIDWILENVGNRIGLDSEEILKHPFYWNPWKILSFISVTSNFFKEHCQTNSDAQEVNEPKQKFNQPMVDFNVMKDDTGEDSIFQNNDAENTANFDGIRLYMTKGKRKRTVDNYLQLIKAIRDKVRIVFVKFGTRLTNQ